MPFIYPERSRLKDEMIARVTAGEPLEQVCAAPGHPTYHAVYHWRRADPAFDAELKTAMFRGAWRRRWHFDEAKAQALLARLRTGEPIGAILRDPRMPSFRVYCHWRATQGHFQEEVGRLNGLKAVARGRRMRDRFRPFDPAMADRVLVRVAHGAALARLRAADPALPSRPVLIRWRRENPEYDRALRTAILAGIRVRARARHRFTPAMRDEILARVAAGASLRRLGQAPDMPCAATLYRWVRLQPGFAAELAQVLQDRADQIADAVLEIVDPENRDPAVAVGRRLFRLKRRVAGLDARAARLRRR